MTQAKPHSLLIVISAPSGGGKTTLCNLLLEKFPNVTRAITCTTRPARDGEKDGADYYFLDAETFLKRVQAGHFLEHATVFGNSYGTLKSEVVEKLRGGKHVLLSVDVQGAATIRHQAETDQELKRSLITVFLAPPSIAALEQRLKKRGKDSPSVIEARLKVARHEISQARHFKYIIQSDSIDHDLHCMIAIIDAEMMKQFRVQLPSYE